MVSTTVSRGRSPVSRSRATACLADPVLFRSPVDVPARVRTVGVGGGPGLLHPLVEVTDAVGEHLGRGHGGEQAARDGHPPGLLHPRAATRAPSTGSSSASTRTPAPSGAVTSTLSMRKASRVVDPARASVLRAYQA